MNSSICDREEAQVAEWLQSQAAAGESPRLPTSSQLWWRAQILRGLSEPDPAVARATRPVMWSMVAGIVAALVAVVLLVVQGLSRVQTTMAGASSEPASLWIFIASAMVGIPIAACCVVALFARDEGLIH